MIDENYNYGLLYLKQGNIVQAIAYFEKSIASNPANIDSIICLGDCHKSLGQNHEAMVYYLKASDIDPNRSYPYVCIGNLLSNQQRYNEALECFKHGIKVSPDNIQAHIGLAIALENLGRLDLSIEVLRQATLIDKQNVAAHIELGIRLLRAGDFENGSKEYKWRYLENDFPLPVWNGETYEGKNLLLYSDTNLEDSILYARYFPFVKQSGGYLTVMPHPCLNRLFSNYNGVDQLHFDKESLTGFDFAANISSLHFIIKTRFDAFPYIYPQKPSTLLINKILPHANKKKIGLVVPNLFNIEPISDLDSVRWFFIQPDCEPIKHINPTSINTANLPKNGIDLSILIDDAQDMAAAISMLDLIITHDCPTAHIAGAMGKPVFLILPEIAHWRWMQNSTETHWYPSIKIFRESQTYKRQNIIESIASALREQIQIQMQIQMSQQNLENKNDKNNDKNNESNIKQRIDSDRFVVHGIGYYWSYLGYNIHTTYFFKYLSEQTLMIPTELRFPQRLERNIKLIERCYPGHKKINIAIRPGHFLDVLDKCQDVKIGYTVWETTIIPDEWHPILNSLDQIWIPSKWGQAILIKNGFDPSKIKVVPEGVDPSVFNRNQEKIREINKISAFKFLNVGKFEERKFTKELLIAFDKEFCNTNDVVLILSCNNPSKSDFNIKQTINSLSLKHPEKIIPVDSIIDHKIFARLYNSCDAFVFPTRAEGWGLPIIEAMACGLPVIVTNYSGQTEFVTEKNAYLLNYTTEDIPLSYYPNIKANYGQWAKPDIEHLRYLMRYIYSNKEEAFEKGKLASYDVFNRFTWKHSALIAMNEILKIV